MAAPPELFSITVEVSQHQMKALIRRSEGAHYAMRVPLENTKAFGFSAEGPLT